MKFQNTTLTGLIAELFDISEAVASELHNGWRLKEAHELTRKYRELPQFSRLARKVSVAKELSERMRDTVNEPPKQITCSSDSYELFRPYLNRLEVEKFYVALLSRANRVIKVVEISQGGVSGTVVDVKVILRHAIEVSASSIILAHNHPSGNYRPSGADLELTRKIKSASKTMDIVTLDHIIVAKDNGYRSLADYGEM